MDLCQCLCSFRFWGTIHLLPELMMRCSWFSCCYWSYLNKNNCRCSELKLPNKFLLPWNKRNINVEIYSCWYNANSFIWFHGWKQQNLGVTQIRCMGERNVNMEVTRLGHFQVLVIILSHKEKVGFYCCTADRTECNNMKVTWFPGQPLPVKWQGNKGRIIDISMSNS